MSTESIYASQFFQQDIQAKLLLSKKGQHELPLRRQSFEDEGLEIKFLDDTDVEYEVMRTVSVSRGKRLRSSFRDFADHPYNDSGFNSSDDDKDDVTNTNFAESPVLNKDSPNNTGANIHGRTGAKCAKCCDKAVSQNALNLGCCNKTDFQSSFNSSNMPSEIGFAHSGTGNFTDSETMTGGQLVSILPGAAHSGSLPERIGHSRRRRVKDSNNNDCVNPLHSYLKPSPFKLNECFQDKGLFCLLVCIVYTLILFFILGSVGLIMDLIKSALSKDDLAEIKASFSHARLRRRTRSGTSG